MFVETPCDLPNVSTEIRPRLTCGFVVAPRSYDNPSGPGFRLAIVIVRAAQQPPLPDPVVFISGGPGGPLTIYADHQARTPYAPSRDLILVDQRGVGRSEPHICPNRNARLLAADVAVAADPDENALAQRRAAFAACRDEAIRRGVDLTHFGTVATAEDFDWVRRALGVARWNVFGESYGTEVAMTLAARHPGTVRSVVLDSIYAPDPAPSRSALVGRARAAFFAACARDAACSTAYPDLAGIYRDALRRFADAPPVIPAPPILRAPDGRMRLTATLFEALVANLLYYPPAYPTLPRLIADARVGDVALAAQALASVVGAASAQMIGANAAVECRDRSGYRGPLPDGANVLDRMQLNGVCGEWAPLGPGPIIPVGTTAPILVLAGEFDPVSGPALSSDVAARIGPAAKWVEFAQLGHNVRAFSPCGAQIASDFIDQPDRPLDTACASQTPPIAFAGSPR